MHLSIKKRIHWGFYTLASIFVINAIIIIATLTYNNKRSDHLIQVADPSLREMNDFRKMLLQSQMYSTNWVFIRSNEEDKRALEELQVVTYPNLKGRLLALSSRWIDYKMVDSLKSTLNGYENLVVQEKLIMNTLQKFDDYDDPVKRFGAEDKLQDDIIPLSEKLGKSLAGILAKEQLIRMEDEENLRNSYLFMRILISTLAILVIALAVFLSMYMAKVIIKPINYIIDIVNDLGKGVIRTVDYKANGDEIGKMVRSVHQLSHNQLASAMFAHEIGNRNFNAVFEPLSEDDVLGKSLVAMRDNLLSSEKELNSANFERETLFRNIEEVFFSIQFPDTKLLQMSPACLKVFGYSVEEFKNDSKLWYDVVLREDKIIVDANSKVMYAGKAFTQEYRIRHKNGSIRWVETKITPTLDKEGKLIRIDGVTSDTTIRRETEEAMKKNMVELRKTNSELDKFVYSVSHDLRAPLTSMLGVIGLTDMMTKEELTKKHLAMLATSVNKLDSFILDILNYSRNARMEVKNVEINFDEMIADVTDNLKYMGGNNRVADIRITTHEDIPFRSDKSRLTVVLNNLISNAIRYQNPKVETPYVEVNVNTTVAEACIIIKDNGIGIEKDAQQKVFEMFYRVSENSVGSGLGLYLVKETIDKLKGRIEIESELGKGTTFFIYLPNTLVTTEFVTLAA